MAPHLTLRRSPAKSQIGFGACASIVLFAFGCTSPSTHHVEPKPAPDAGTTDFSALDPAHCTAINPEDLGGCDATRTLATSGSWQEDKSFYVLTLLDTSPDATAAVKASAAIAAIATARSAALANAVATCPSDVACLAQAAKWSASDMNAVGDALAALEGSSPAIQALTTSLRKSCYAALHASSSDADLLRAAWIDSATTLNQGFDDHVADLPIGTVTTIVSQASSTASSAPFHTPLLQIVLAGLIADGRDESSRYEPLAAGENSAAVAHLPDIDFSQYPFTVILVPGQGPNDLDHPLDPEGQTRADQGAARFAAHLAPLIALSGGHVHPDRTPYSEALEMKQYLMTTYAIPESAILVDPYARHTTTNVRNVGRLLYRYGAPVGRPALLTSDWLQTLTIAGSSETDGFGMRCIDELGYLPYRGITQLDELDDCWVPAVGGLFADAGDLLDP